MVDNAIQYSIIRNMSNYDDSISRQAARFKALSNPHRLAIFQRLCTCCVPGTVCKSEEAMRYCVGDLGEGLNIAPSTLSHHLKELHHAGLITMARNGKNVECWVEAETLQELSAFFTIQQQEG